MNTGILPDLIAEQQLAVTINRLWIDTRVPEFLNLQKCRGVVRARVVSFESRTVSAVRQILSRIHTVSRYTYCSSIHIRVTVPLFSVVDQKGLTGSSVEALVLLFLSGLRRNAEG